MLDKLGSPNTYNHYPTGWAMAFSTPFRMFKRYSYQGGICDPLVIHWPQGIKAKGEVRNQYHHAIDIVPTILECCGLELPRRRTRLRADAAPRRLDALHLRRRERARPQKEHPVLRDARHPRPLGRGLEGGHRARAAGRASGNFDDDKWQLFHTDEDRSEAHDLAEQYHREAATSLSSSGSRRRRSTTCFRSTTGSPHRDPALEMPEAPIPPRRDLYVLPGHVDVPEFGRSEHSRPLLQDPRRGRSHRAGTPKGVVFAHGSRFGGHALFVKERKLWYVYNFLGIPPEQQLVSTTHLGSGKHVLGMEFTKEIDRRARRAIGTTKLYVDDEVVAEAPLKTQAGHFALCGEGLSIGRDTGDPVSKEYTAHFPFTGGQILEVEVNIGDDLYLDTERTLAAAMARD